MSEDDMKTLEALYIRSEIQDGYYYRHNGKEMITATTPGYSGSDDRLLDEIRAKYLSEKMSLPVKMQAYFYKEQEAVLTVQCGDAYVTVTGGCVQKALKQPVTKDNIRDGLAALGDTVFVPEELIIDCEEDIFYPLKAIKDLRREAIAQLERELILSEFPELASRRVVFPEERDNAKQTIHGQEENRTTGFYVFVTTYKQLQGVLKAKIQPTRLYVDADLCATAKEWEDIFAQLRNAERNNQVKEIYITLPYIIRQRDEHFMENLYQVLEMADGCMVRNVEGYAYLKKAGYAKPVSADAGFYQWNEASREFWSDKISSACIPYELNAREQETVVRKGLWEKVVYGRLPMMITANCIANTAEQCLVKTKNLNPDRRFAFSLKDRYKTEFPVYTNCSHCYNIIYNSVPLSLHDKLESTANKMAVRLDFTVETEKETREIVDYFAGLLNGAEQGRPYETYTTGHEKKGVL